MWNQASFDCHRNRLKPQILHSGLILLPGNSVFNRFRSKKLARTRTNSGPTCDSRMSNQALVPTERIEHAILQIRGQKVVLDRDSAALMGTLMGLRPKTSTKPAEEPQVRVFRALIGSLPDLYECFHGMVARGHRLKQHGQLAELMMAINEVRSSNHAAFDKLQRFANGPRCMMKARHERETRIM